MVSASVADMARIVGRRGSCACTATSLQYPCGMWATNNPSAAARPHAARRRRMWWMVVTIALTMAVLCFVVRLATPAHAQSPLIQAWLALNTECRGGRSDDPKTLQACEEAREGQREAEAQGLSLPGGWRLVETPTPAYGSLGDVNGTSRPSQPSASRPMPHASCFGVVLPHRHGRRDRGRSSGSFRARRDLRRSTLKSRARGAACRSALRDRRQ